MLLEVAMSGDPKRKDTFAEVGGGRGEAMATALTLYPNLGQTALFLPEALKEVHEKMSVVIVSRMSAPLSYFCSDHLRFFCRLRRGPLPRPRT